MEPKAFRFEAGRSMSCWTKEELENMLQDVVNELDLSDGMIEEHGPQGTAPAKLVRLVLDRKDREIQMLKQGFVAIDPHDPRPRPDAQAIAAVPELEGKKALVLYFQTQQDADEFAELIQAVKPGMRTVQL